MTNSNTEYYFAYGSNMDEHKLKTKRKVDFYEKKLFYELHLTLILFVAFLLLKLWSGLSRMTDWTFSSTVNFTTS